MSDNFDDIDERIASAKAYHELVEKEYIKGLDNKKFEGYFKTKPITSFTKIVDALYEYGGGMTEKEIVQHTGLSSKEVSLRLKVMTAGVNVQMYQRAVLEIQLRPVPELVYQEHLGNVPPEAFEINENYTQDPILDEQYGRYYLWCQKDGKSFRRDIYIRYDGIGDTIDKDQAVIESFDAEAHNEIYNKLAAKKQRLSQEIAQLGTFDFSQKKKLHKELIECESRLTKCVAKAEAYAAAVAEIQHLIKDLNAIKL